MEMSEWQSVFSDRKACVLVPTYNNGGTLRAVLEGLLRITSDVIVVNDGSTDDTASILAQFPDIDLVSYGRNRGKGWALRTGFAHARSRGYEYAITIDSDGQHYVEDLPGFLEAMATSPQALLVGARNMDQEGVPGKSSFGHKFSNFWFWVETGIRLPDTQSGYRAYPLRPLSEIRFFTRKFEFEIEVLVRAAWHGIEIGHVPVRVYYPEPGKRISHFRPFKDFTRISLLNTVLVIMAILYIKPRDFFRGLKKKASGISYTNSYST